MHCVHLPVVLKSREGKLFCDTQSHQSHISTNTLRCNHFDAFTSPLSLIWWCELKSQLVMGMYWANSCGSDGKQQGFPALLFPSHLLSKQSRLFHKSPERGRAISIAPQLSSGSDWEVAWWHQRNTICISPMKNSRCKPRTQRMSKQREESKTRDSHTMWSYPLQPWFSSACSCVELLEAAITNLLNWPEVTTFLLSASKKAVRQDFTVAPATTGKLLNPLCSKLETFPESSVLQGLCKLLCLCGLL